MILAISSQGEGLDSAVDPRFGRAPFFIIYNTEDKQFEVVSNAINLSAAQGAGIQAAQLVAEKKPDLVISGNLGPKAFRALSAAGIKAAAWSNGTVQEAIKLAESDQLSAISEANVQGHWS